MTSEFLAAVLTVVLIFIFVFAATALYLRRCERTWDEVEYRNTQFSEKSKKR